MPEKAFRPDTMRPAAAILASVFLVAACEPFPGADDDSSLKLPAGEPARQATRSEASFEIERFYRRVEAGLVARGLLRQDGGGTDAPFSPDDLARNFEKLVFSQEFTGTGRRILRQNAPTVLHRWVARVRIEPVFGASVDTGQKLRDRATIERFAGRLAAATGHPISTVTRGGNFRVLVLNDHELRAAGDLLRDAIPGIGPAEVAYVEDMPRETYCVVFAADPGEDGTYSRAVAVIRAELPERLRTSCIHEEIAQGLGISNDSPRARPSIFNDDDEFGRLTAMDELLLAMLYDNRLRPGMSLEDARPLLLPIAQSLMVPQT